MNLQPANGHASEPVVICEDVMQKDLRQLATCVVLQALEDAKHARGIERKLDAALWLTGPDISWWCEWAGMPFADPFEILTSGAARKSQTRRRNGHERRHPETV